MAYDIQTLLSLYTADKVDGLSERDCWLALAGELGANNGINARQAAALASTNRLTQLSERDLLQVLEYLFCSGLSRGSIFANQWAAQVVTNGGVRPTTDSITAVANFQNGLISDGLSGQMICWNAFAPDNLIAAITPQLVGSGITPWLSSVIGAGTPFAGSNLKSNGLKGNGAAFLVPQIDCSVVFVPPTSAGWSMYGYLSGDNTGSDFGYITGTTGFWGAMAQGGPFNSISTIGATTNKITSLANASGFFSGNRVSGSDHRLYFANSSSNFAQVSTTDNAAWAGTFQGIAPPTIFCDNNSTLPGQEHGSFNTISFFGFHKGLSSGQSQLLYNRVASLRAELLVSDWARRVVSNGGAAPSANTKAALIAFQKGIMADGIDSKMLAWNAIVPDSTMAARTPQLVGGGNDPWTQVGTGATLGINGWVGTGSAANYFNTGIATNAIYSSDNNVGVTAYCYNAINSANEYICGSSDAGPTNNFNLGNAISTFIQLNAFGATAGTFIQTAGPFNGYISGNRISSTSLAVFKASSTFPHGQAASVATTGGVRNASNIFVLSMSVANANSLGLKTSATVSFIAWHQALTLAQSALFYARIQTLRQALGGGWT